MKGDQVNAMMKDSPAGHGSAETGPTRKRCSTSTTKREYLYVEHLAELTPWTPSAIRTMMSRGRFKEGVHYFKRCRERPVFKWSAVVELIESPSGEVDRADDGVPDRIFE